MSYAFPSVDPLPIESVVTSFRSRSEMYYFAAKELNGRVSAWNVGDDLNSQNGGIKLRWQVFFKSLEDGQKGLPGAHERSVSALQQLCRYFPIDPGLNRFKDTDLVIFPNNTQNPLPECGIKEEELEPLNQLYDRFLDYCAFPTYRLSIAVKKIIRTILSRREGRELIGQIVNWIDARIQSRELPQGKNGWIEFKKADVTEAVVEDYPKTQLLVGNSLLPYSCETKEHGKISIFPPLFLEVFHELNHICNAFEDIVESDRLTELPPVRPEDRFFTNQEEHRVIKRENRFAAQFKFLPRASHRAGILPTLSPRANLRQAAIHGRTVDLVRFRGQVTSSQAQEVVNNLRPETAQDLQSLIQQGAFSPDRRGAPSVLFISPLRPPAARTEAPRGNPLPRSAKILVFPD